MELKEIFRNARKKQKLSLTDVANQSKIDITSISKIEGGSRLPTRPQILALADVYSLDSKQILIDFLSDRIVDELKNETVALEALQLANKKLKVSIQK